MRTWILSFAIFLSLSLTAYAQIGINPSNDPPALSAGVDVDFADRGFLQPRLTAEEITAISNPAVGLMVFNLSSGKPIYFDGITWRNYDGTTSWSGCGDQIEVVHIRGAVAPVSKTVSYGTVTGIPGEPDKCWITRNLGSDHQAAAVDDATEASAGWYWQFNRKQGYMHTGATVTPAWNITSIEEDSDWIPANDPCAIELGAGWRLPTSTEWINVDASGGWDGWDDPWNSALKIHAAGYISESDGSLVIRGTGGFYWSGTQETATTGWYIILSNSDVDQWYTSKASGYSVRCIKQ
jgi:hypothetical protein